MRIVGIIPSRYASSRFPGKPLVDIKGKSMIQRVYEQAGKSDALAEVIVATDDDRIFDHVQSFGGKVMMTAESHRNGTERCGEVARNFEADYYINIQGDEPFIRPEQIDTLASVLDGKVELGTLIKRITDPALLDNPSVMKVVKTGEDLALYFSRNCIPYVRDSPKEDWVDKHVFYKHIGIYAYRTDVLDKIIELPAGQLEAAESLEQLRWLENGYHIKVAETEFETTGVDTPADLERILNLNLE